VNSKRQISSFDKLSEIVIKLSLIVAGLFILPGVSYDATNLPRFVLLTIMAAVALPNVINTIRTRAKSGKIVTLEFWALMFVFLYCLTALITSLFNETSTIQEWFGDFGRSTGILSYLAIFTLFLAAMYISQMAETRKFQSFLRTLFQLCLIYAVLQNFNIDPIDWDNVFGSALIGTFGNPNFQSIFTTMVSLFFGAWILNGDYPNKLFRYLDMLCFIISASLTLVNPSSQGQIALLIGSVLLLISRFPRKLRSRFLSFSVGILLFGFALLLWLVWSGSYLQIPTLAQNLQFRVIVWKASINLIHKEPLTGTGFDSFGSWFYEFRDPTLSKAYSTETSADAVHSVFLDQAVNGGLFLMLCYLGLFFVVAICIFIAYSRKERISPTLSFLSATWVVFLIHNLVSINQLGIAVFGFIFAGLLLGLSLEIGAGKEGRGKRKSSILNVILPITVGLIPLQILHKDISYLSALESQDGLKAIQVSSRWPQNDFYLSRTAEILYNNDFPQLGKVEAEKALITNKRNVIALRLLAKDPSLNESRKNEILADLKEVDPISFEAIAYRSR